MLLEKHSSVSIHDRNIQCLATEIYKVSNGLSLPLVRNIFRQTNSHLTICDLTASFSDLLLGLYFKGPTVYPILVQLSGTYLLIATQTNLILVFIKTVLKDGNLRIMFITVSIDV